MDFNFFLPCFYSFFACAGFCFLLNVKKFDIIICSLGGALGWLIYLLFSPLANDIIQSFIGAFFVSIYAEILARVIKRPVTCFSIVGILPLVPGNGIYKAMEYCINGDTQNFATETIHTIAIAGALAFAILLVSSAVHILNQIKFKNIRN